MIQRNSFSCVFFFLNNHNFLFCCFFKKSCMVPKVSPLGATDLTVRNTGFCPAAFSVQLFSPGPGSSGASAHLGPVFLVSGTSQCIWELRTELSGL